MHSMKWWAISLKSVTGLKITQIKELNVLSASKTTGRLKTLASGNRLTTNVSR